MTNLLPCAASAARL